MLGSFETGLGVARALGRAGISVCVVDASSRHAAHSRYASFSRSPSPAVDPDGAMRHLERLAAGAPRRPVLYLADDEFLEPVSRWRDRLASSYQLNLPGAELLARIVDKAEQAELARESGIAVPRTVVVNGVADIARALERQRYPVLVKGRFSCLWRRVQGGTLKGVVARRPKELCEQLQRFCELGLPVVVQDLVPGPASNHFKVSAAIAPSGHLLAAFTLRKIRQCPPGLGFGCAVETVHRPDLLELGLGFFEAIGYRGVASAEFKLDERDGTFKLIELNPRYWQQNALAERIGMNFPLLEYQALAGREQVARRTFEPGVRWINLHRDLDIFRVLRSRRELGWVGWIRSWGRQRVWSDFALDDPAPGIWALFAELSRVRALARRFQRRTGKCAAPATKLGLREA